MSVNCRSLAAASAVAVLLLLLLLNSANGKVLVNCFPELDRNHDPGQVQCSNRKCIPNEHRTTNSPACLLERTGYHVNRTESNTPELYSARLIRDADFHGPFPDSKDEDELKLSVKAIHNNGIRVQFTDVNNTRFTVPKEALDIPEPGPTEGNAVYSWSTNSADEFVQIQHKASGTNLLGLQLSGFVFSDQFIQIAMRLSCSKIYGFGEHNHERLLHDRDYRRWTIWTRDASPTEPVNLYGAHPYFICGNDQVYTGVLLKNANAMEVELTPDGIVYRTVGGVLDFYIFIAESPEAVTRHYSYAIGHPLMPPYWSLGFQLCRWGYRNISEVREVVRRNRAMNLPYDVQYGDIDYMQNTMDFTIDHNNYPDLDKLVDDLHEHGQKYFVILDPAISSDTELHERVLPSKRYEPYHDGLQRDIFIKNPNGSVHEGEVWPGRTVFPDFSLPANQQWWDHWVKDFYYNQSIKVDGLWIDMNEPASFTYEPHKSNNCSYNKWNYPPYRPTSFLGDRFYEKTLCMDAQENWGKHYDTHSLYGHAMSMQSYQTLRTLFPDKRPIVFSRSTYVGTGRYAQHWLGDNHSRWSNLHWSIITMIEFGLFGFPYTGADICGFVYDAEEEMCIRWMQLGAFYPFSRNHNIKETDGHRTRDQDPGSWPPAAQKIMREAMEFRYKYLPYLYTLFHRAHTEGATVVRSLNHEFPTDANTAAIDRQFLWGSAMLITPVLDQGKTSVTGYFPSDGWYDAFNGKELPQVGNVTLNAPLEKFNVHIRKGFILPWQPSAVTTEHSRKNPMGLTVALKKLQENPAKYQANGELFWDDGVGFETFKSGRYILHSFEFSTDTQLQQHTLSIKADHSGHTEQLNFTTIDIYGLEASEAELSVQVNSGQHDKFQYNADSKSLQLTELQLKLGSSHQIVFKVKAAGTVAATATAVLLAAVLSMLTNNYC